MISPTSPPTSPPTRPPLGHSSPPPWQAAALMRLHHKYLNNPWVVQKPHPKQVMFLLHDDWFEGLYGGAAGGAKSSALLMAAAADVDVPGYSALLLRESFADLNQ